MDKDGDESNSRNEKIGKMEFQTPATNDMTIQQSFQLPTPSYLLQYCNQSPVGSHIRGSKRRSPVRPPDPTSKKGDASRGGVQNYAGKTKQRSTFSSSPCRPTTNDSSQKQDIEGQFPGNDGEFRNSAWSSADCYGEGTSKGTEPALKAAKMLPPDFEPCPYSVVIGKGSASSKAIGNQRIRVLASAMLPRYTEAKNRAEKTRVINDLIETVHNAAPGGSFVQFKNGRWWSVGEHAAREKIGYIIRDLLQDRYKSSSKSKATMRKQRKLEGDRKMQSKKEERGGGLLQHPQECRSLQQYESEVAYPENTFSTAHHPYDPSWASRSQFFNSSFPLYPGMDSNISNFAIPRHVFPTPISTGSNYLDAVPPDMAFGYNGNDEASYLMPPPVGSNTITMAVPRDRQSGDGLTHLLNAPIRSSSDDSSDVPISPTEYHSPRKKRSRKGLSPSKETRKRKNSE